MEQDKQYHCSGVGAGGSSPSSLLVGYSKNDLTGWNDRAIAAFYRGDFAQASDFFQKTIRHLASHHTGPGKAPGERQVHCHPQQRPSENELANATGIGGTKALYLVTSPYPLSSCSSSGSMQQVAATLGGFPIYAFPFRIHDCNDHHNSQRRPEESSFYPASVDTVAALLLFNLGLSYYFEAHFLSSPVGVVRQAANLQRAFKTWGMGVEVLERQGLQVDSLCGALAASMAIEVLLALLNNRTHVSLERFDFPTTESHLELLRNLLADEFFIHFLGDLEVHSFFASNLLCAQDHCSRPAPSA